jgi:TonB family protein
MKWFCCLSLLMPIATSLIQAQSRVYYDENNNISDAAKCHYFTMKVNAKKGRDSLNSYYCKDNSRKMIAIADKNGVLNGDLIEYYEGGVIKSKVRIESNNKVDSSISWYPTGKKCLVLYLGTNDKPQYKIVHFWDSTGNQTVRNGNGHYQFYHTEGEEKLLLSGNVKNGIQDSTWNFYSSKGILIKQETYKDGKLISSKMKPRQNEGDSETFSVVDESAVPIGGMASFYRAIAQHIKYPAAAYRNNIAGKVFVEFVVELDGTLSNITVIKGIGGGCDEEAARVVLFSPQWKPGVLAGKMVRQKMVVPISFRLGVIEK